MAYPEGSVKGFATGCMPDGVIKYRPSDTTPLKAAAVIIQAAVALSPCHALPMPGTR
jgi:hypothetical protein